jgi:SAM-dependent methyltransferase
VRATSEQPVPELDAERRTPRCAWCGAAALATGSRLAICSSCGSATTYPAPDRGELERAYGGWYRPTSGRFSAGGDRLLARSRATLARRLDRISPPGPILDVGCGEGWLLRALRARGREAVGLERAPGAEPADGVLATEIADFRHRAGEWSGVVFWHSLEHLPAAAPAVDRATELLVPGGMLVIAVPNFSSLQARTFGGRWFHLDLPRHLVHLRAEALAEGVSARGFTIERVSHWRAGQQMFGWLHGIVGTLPGRPDLYSAIRRSDARADAMTTGRRAALLATATALAPVAATVTAAEVAAREGGTVYIEARRR